MFFEILLILGFVSWFFWAFWFLHSTLEDLVFPRKRGFKNGSDNKNK